MTNVLTRDTASMGRAAIGGGVVTYKAFQLFGAGSTAEQDTSYDLPANCVIHEPPFALVTAAASAGSVLDVGLLASESGGDADGFLDGVSVATTGIRVGAVTVNTSGASSTGVAQNFVSACTIGALLGTFVAGSTFVTVYGSFVPKDHNSDAVTARSISWTLNSSTNTSFRATLIVPILEFQA